MIQMDSHPSVVGKANPGTRTQREDHGANGDLTSWASASMQGPPTASNLVYGFPGHLGDVPYLAPAHMENINWDLEYSGQGHAMEVPFLSASPERSFPADSPSTLAGSSVHGLSYGPAVYTSCDVSPRIISSNPLTQSAVLDSPYTISSYQPGLSAAHLGKENFWIPSQTTLGSLSSARDASTAEAKENKANSPGSSSSETSSAARDDPLYMATVGSDGLWHCPWNTPGFRNSPGSCSHAPAQLKCNYDKMVDSHLKPYRCTQPECSDKNFSSMACRLRHEREAHGMHNHGKNPHVCHYENCERNTNGFPRRWNLLDHMKRVHNYSPDASETQVIGSEPPAMKGKNTGHDLSNSQIRKRSSHASDAIQKAGESEYLILDGRNSQGTRPVGFFESPKNQSDAVYLARQDLENSIQIFDQLLDSYSAMDPQVAQNYTHFLNRLSKSLVTFDPRTVSRTNSHHT